MEPIWPVSGPSMCTRSPETGDGDYYDDDHHHHCDYDYYDLYDDHYDYDYDYGCHECIRPRYAHPMMVIMIIVAPKTANNQIHSNKKY